MHRTNLTELAANPNFISGIYNYCDRWCERCPFTSRCLVYAQELEDADEPPECRDITNEAFWQKLASIFKETRELVEQWAKEAGVDLNAVDEEMIAGKKRGNRVAQTRLAKAGKQYASVVSKWFSDFDQTL